MVIKGMDPMDSKARVIDYQIDLFSSSSPSCSSCSFSSPLSPLPAFQLAIRKEEKPSLTLNQHLFFKSYKSLLTGPAWVI